MKAFWAVLVALVLAGAGYIVFAGKKRDAQQTQLVAQKQVKSAQQASAPAPGPALPSADELASLKQQKDEAAAKLSGPNKVPAAAPVAPDAKKPEGETVAAAPAAEPPKPEQPKAEAPKTEPAKPEPSKPQTAEQPKPSKSDSGFSISDGTVAPVGVTGAPTKAVVATVKEEKKLFAGFEIIPATIEKKDNGTLLVDGKYTIKGEGTAEKPYVVPWDVLTSVEETFDPQSAKKKLPERVTMLDGKVVKLSGYIAFPMMVKEAKECLSMLNQWDGCCIGTPPTPYDAVEVSLKRTITGDERFTTSGQVTGVFRVKPYLQGDWLIGLYVMETGDLKSRDYGGSAGN